MSQLCGVSGATYFILIALLSVLFASSGCTGHPASSQELPQLVKAFRQGNYREAELALGPLLSKHLRGGMTKEEVIRILGAPDEIVEVPWAWRKESVKVTYLGYRKEQPILRVLYEGEKAYNFEIEESVQDTVKRFRTGSYWEVEATLRALINHLILQNTTEEELVVLLGKPLREEVQRSSGNRYLVYRQEKPIVKVLMLGDTASDFDIIDDIEVSIARFRHGRDIYEAGAATPQLLEDAHKPESTAAPLRIGMTKEEIISLLGEPQKTQKGAITYRHDIPILEIFLDDEGKMTDYYLEFGY